MADVNFLHLVFQTCSTLQLYCSLKLNLEKSEACWIGNKTGSYEMPISCKWVNINAMPCEHWVFSIVMKKTSKKN